MRWRWVSMIADLAIGFALARRAWRDARARCELVKSHLALDSLKSRDFRERPASTFASRLARSALGWNRSAVPFDADHCRGAAPRYGGHPIGARSASLPCRAGDVSWGQRNRRRPVT